jgi:hypothetical protein
MFLKSLALSLSLISCNLFAGYQLVPFGSLNADVAAVSDLKITLAIQTGISSSQILSVYPTEKTVSVLFQGLPNQYTIVKYSLFANPGSGSNAEAIMEHLISSDPAAAAFRQANGGTLGAASRIEFFVSSVGTPLFTQGEVQYKLILSAGPNNIYQSGLEDGSGLQYWIQQ